MKRVQHTHQSTRFVEKKHSITLVCDGITSPANMGSIFRLCDAFGVEKVIFCNSKVNLDSPRLKKTARNTLYNTSFLQEENINQVLSQIKIEGKHLIGIEIASTSTAIHKIKLPFNKSIALVIGNERTGISDDALQKLDQIVHIDMFGKNSSMNVSHAAAIALFEFTKNNPLF